jgi:hypothetical protein
MMMMMMMNYNSESVKIEMPQIVPSGSCCAGMQHFPPWGKTNFIPEIGRD